MECKQDNKTIISEKFCWRGNSVDFQYRKLTNEMSNKKEQILIIEPPIELTFTGNASSLWTRSFHAVTSKFLPQRHQVRRVEGLKTIMDYLEITGAQHETTVIFNHLVDQKCIEAVVICKTQEETKKICTYQSNVPKNMDYAITHDFYKFHPPTGSSSYRSYYITSRNSQMLGVSMNNRVDQKMAEIRKASDAMSEIIANSVKLLEKEASLKEQNEEIRSQITEWRRKLQKLSSDKSQLKAQEDGLDNLDRLQEKLDGKSTEFEKISTSQENLLLLREEIMQMINNKSNEYTNKSKEVFKLREATEPIEREIS